MLFHAYIEFHGIGPVNRYLMSNQQRKLGSSTSTPPNFASKGETLSSLFGDNQLARVRMIQTACDAQRGLDPHAELKLYLDEPLYKGDLSPMGWWKVSTCPHMGAIEI